MAGKNILLESLLECFIFNDFAFVVLQLVHTLLAVFSCCCKKEKQKTLHLNIIPGSIF